MRIAILTLALVLLAACDAPGEAEGCESFLECGACELCVEGRCVLDPGQLNPCGQCGPTPAEVCLDEIDNDCDGLTDEDCLAVSCGNGRLDPGELCDGDCPEDCDDGDPCTADSRSGAPETCDVRCEHSPVESCADGDGCCPEGCGALSDDDCPPVCDNGVLEPGESCDGDCPTSCDDGNPCTVDSQTGSAETCDLICLHEPLRECLSGDECCPAGCVAEEDDDCTPCPDGEYPCPTGCCVWELEDVDDSPMALPRPALALDGEGRVHVAYVVTEGDQQQVRYARRDVEGWTREDLGAPGPVGGLDLALDAEGRPRVALHDAENDDLLLATRAGSGWQVQGALVSAAAVGRHPSLAVRADDGALAVAFFDATEFSLDLLLDSGSGWQRQVVDESGGTAGHLAFDPRGQPSVAFFIGYANQDKHLRFRRWNEQVTRYLQTELITWSSGAVDDVPAVELAYGADGAPHAVCVVQSAAGDSLQHSYDFGGGNWFSAPVLEVFPGGRAWDVSMAMRRDGRPVLLYAGDANDARWRGLILLRAVGARWSLLEVASLDTSQALGADLALDTHEQPHFVFHDPSTGGLRYGRQQP